MTIDEFIDELKLINININDKQLELLNNYYKILIEKNTKMNLTGITEKEDVYLKHFYDSLTINKIIDLNKINNLCDLGSGAGFPGIVIKILFPTIKIDLIDSLGKRIEFLKYVINKLELKGINAINSRIEEYTVNNKEKYDLVTARAVATANVLLEIGIQSVKTNGFFITMKGKKEEINYSIYEKLNVKKVSEQEFKLPMENSDRTLTLYKKTKPTNAIFPRKYNEIKKNPL